MTYKKYYASIGVNVKEENSERERAVGAKGRAIATSADKWCGIYKELVDGRLDKDNNCGYSSRGNTINGSLLFKSWRLEIYFGEEVKRNVKYVLRKMSCQEGRSKRPESDHEEW